MTRINNPYRYLVWDAEKRCAVEVSFSPSPLWRKQKRMNDPHQNDHHYEGDGDDHDHVDPHFRALVWRIILLAYAVAAIAGLHLLGWWF